MHNKNRQTIGYVDNLSVHGSMQANTQVLWALERGNSDMSAVLLNSVLQLQSVAIAIHIEMCLK